jgi:hypothetical protein
MAILLRCLHPWLLLLLLLQISSPFQHKSDSFYFVDNKLIMHNKAEYQYLHDH